MNISIHQADSVTIKKETIKDSLIGDIYTIKISVQSSTGVDNITIFTSEPIDIKEG